MTQFTVFLEKQRTKAHVGWYENERKTGVDLVISVAVTLKEYQNQDDLTHTVDYARLVEIVNKEALKERKLLESLASGICSEIEILYQQILHELKITIAKQRIEVTGFDAEGTGVVLHRRY